MRKNVFLPNGNNKSTFQPEGAAPATSSLKSSYIKNEEKLSKERGTLKYSFYDIAGKLLRQGVTRNGEHNKMIESNGVYLLKATDAAGNQVVKKIVLP